MIVLETIILLSVIITGTRLQGVGLGIMGGLGLAIFMFGFHIKPTAPPLDLLLIITSVVVASGTLEAAGGLTYLAHLVTQILRRSPQQLTLLAPIVTYLFTWIVGTGHIVYSILPIVAAVAKDTGIRPERPLVTTVIAAQQAVMASPISAPVAMMVGLFAPYGITLLDMLQILFPATLGSILVTALVVNKLGKRASGEEVSMAMAHRVQIPRQSAETGPPATAKRAISIFVLGIIMITLLSAFKRLKPCWVVDGAVVYVDTPTLIVTMMLSIAALIVLTCGVNPQSVTKSSIFTSGIQAMIAILGIAWLGDTFVEANKEQIIALVQRQIQEYPWQFSVILFFMSIVFLSQTATIRALAPIGLMAGLSASTLLATLPGSNGLFFIPNHPTVLAAINLDDTGSTRVGKWVLNHSFMVPGLIATSTAVCIAFALVWLKW
ncbi:MAG: anaerobic C4-dicarboxylate transporter family protein [Bacteroidota bacterium]